MFPFSSPSFNPDKDVPLLDGKVILVTGGNSGIGLESIIQLAKHSPSKIYLCARSKAKYDTAMEHIAKSGVHDAAKIVHFLEFDLQSFASVKKAADTFIASNERLDILMNNAGIAAQPAALTTDGYELQFGTNHMGHALLTKLLLPTLSRTAKSSSTTTDVRIINIASEAYKAAPRGGLHLDACKTDMSTFNTGTRYGQSKLANILFTRSLADKYPEIVSVSLHPGVVKTNIWGPLVRDYFFLGKIVGAAVAVFAVSPVTGAWNQVWAATAPAEGRKGKGMGKEGGSVAAMKTVKSGAYYVPVAKEEGRSGVTNDLKLAEKLWVWTETELQAHGY